MSASEQPEACESLPPAGDDDGYMLLGLIVAIALLLLWLSVAATNEAFSIRRDREVEAARRADQYVRAIRLYYKKFGHYPGSVEQLEKSNNVRFLRRRWIDPLTGSTDWRTIEVGKNLTTPRGFFGEPLAGLPTSGLGALAGSLSPGMPGTPAAPTGAGPGLGAAPAAAATPATPGPTFGISPTSILGAAGAGTTPGATTATSATSGVPNTPATNATSTNGATGTNPTGAFMGVGSNATGNSILEVNGQTTYQTWEFLYDPRVEALRLKQQLNSGLQSVSAGALGQPATSGSQDTNALGVPAATPNAFGVPATSSNPAAGAPAPITPAAPGGSGPPPSNPTQ